MRLRILGECAITVDNHEYTPSTAHFFALLLRLGLDAGHYFRRQELAHLLYPQAPNERAGLHSARQLIYQAVQRGVSIEKVGGAVAIAPESVSVDFEDAILQDQSLAGWRHRLISVLPGYAPSISVKFDEWLESFREHQETRFRHALVASIDTLRNRADWRGVEARSRECLSLDPFNEPATLALAEALARTGSKQRAVATLDAYRAEVGPLDAHIAVPAHLLRKRIESGSARALSDAGIPFVARGDEVALLHSQWHRARAGQMECTLIRGESGSGKSRLLEEFHALVSLSGGSNVALVRKSTSERFRPFALFADLVSLLRRFPGAAGCDPGLLPFLNRLTCATIRPDASPTTLDEADFISAGIKRAIVDLLEALSSERPCLILIDDSRAIDDLSLALIRELFIAIPTLRVHLVIACDDGEHREDISRLQARTLALQPLSPEDSREALGAFLATTGHTLGRDALDWCATVAAGNPAFLLLLAAHCTGSSASLNVPLDIVAAVDRRLESLTCNALRVLEACAVLGDDDCSPLVLGAVIGLEPLPLITALHELEHGGLVAYGGERVHLRSALFRDRTLLTAGRSVLSLLHGRCAVAMEDDPASADSYWRIASHWRSAGQHRRARATLSASWRRSLQLGQPAHAEESLREYLSLTTDTGERIALYDDLIELTQASQSIQATVEAIDERTALIRAANSLDPRREALAFDRLDAQLFDQADPSQPEPELLAFMRSPTLNTSRRLRASLRLLVSADATANRALAELVHDELVTFVVGDSVDRAFYDQTLLIYHSVFGSKTAALSLTREIIASARLEPHSWPHIRGQTNASLALQLVGESREAIVSLEECYARVLAAGAVASCVLIASRLAGFHLDDGDLDVAATWAARANAHVLAGMSGRLPSDYLSVRADLALLAGDFAAAREFIATMRDVTPLYEAPRYKMELLSYALRLDQLEGTPVDDADVSLLLDWHLRARSYGRHDDVMDALWVALVQQRQESRASELLSQYLRTYRRETRSCRYFLRTRTAKDPTWLIATPTPSLDGEATNPR